MKSTDENRERPSEKLLSKIGSLFTRLQMYDMIHKRFEEACHTRHFAKSRILT
jgi:hypothetical protein